VNPVPKPRRKRKKPQEMPKRSPVRKRNPKRQRSEFARAYGSKERAEWVRSLRCVVRGCLGASENVHIATGGVSRKADAERIVPMCRLHHTALHGGGQALYEAAWGINLKDEAARTEKLWIEYTQSLTEKK
jgi:hypothetical protein